MIFQLCSIEVLEVCHKLAQDDGYMMIYDYDRTKRWANTEAVLHGFRQSRSPSSREGHGRQASGSACEVDNGR